MDEEGQADQMHLRALRETERFSDELREALSECVVPAFDMIRFSAFFAAIFAGFFATSVSIMYE